MWRVTVYIQLDAIGAYINAQTDETQETALTLACCGGFLEVVQLLAEKGECIDMCVHVCVCVCMRVTSRSIVLFTKSAGKQDILQLCTT